MLRIKLLVLLTIVVAALAFAPAAQADPEGYLVCHEKANGDRILIVVGGLGAVITHTYVHLDVTEWEWASDVVIAACPGGD